MHWLRPLERRSNSSAMDDLEQLYQDLILDHYKQPRHRQALADTDVSAEAENPLCGDQLRLAVEVAEGCVRTIRHDGKGCAISQASASMMSDTLAGKTVAEVQGLVSDFIAAMRGERDFDSGWPDEWLALQGVKKFPLRIKCATLAWHALKSALDKQRSS